MGMIPYVYPNTPRIPRGISRRVSFPYDPYGGIRVPYGVCVWVYVVHTVYATCMSMSTAGLYRILGREDTRIPIPIRHSIVCRQVYTRMDTRMLNVSASAAYTRMDTRMLNVSAIRVWIRVC